jgi:acetoin utilization deacetylase AcuC-like enzyme
MHTAYISHPLCLKHDMGAHHPEAPARIHAIEDQLIASGILDHLQRYEAPEATHEQLLRVHDAAYVDALDAHGHVARTPADCERAFAQSRDCGEPSLVNIMLGQSDFREGSISM